MRKNLKALLKSKSKSFCKHSTLHGVYYFSCSTAWWVHGVWLVVICASFGLCCFLGHMIWQKYAVDPTLTVVETTRYSITNIPHPAISVCDTEMVYGPSTHNISEVLRLRGYNKSQLVDFFNSFTSMKHKAYAPPPHVTKMHSLLEELDYTYKSLLDMFKKPCSELLTECTWRSKSFDCSNMFRSIYTSAGYCCQFDIPYFKLNTKEDVSFISGNQANEALQITVNGERSYYDGSSANGVVLLYVFDHDDQVTLMNSYISLTSSVYFDINVLVWTIDSSDNVKELPVQSRKCTLESDSDIGATFYQACMTGLILQRVVEYCRCLPFDYTHTELGVNEYSACKWEKMLCIYQTIEEMQTDIKHIVLNSQCYQKCDYVEYRTEVECIKMQRNVSGYGNQSRVSVHFNENTCFKYRREILYTWDQMLANLGGIFGLCLGGSIISVIELVWYFMDIIITSLQYATMRKVATFKQKKMAWSKEKKIDGVFTLPQKDFLAKKSPGRVTFYN